MIGHAICTPRGVGVREISEEEQTAGLLVSRDTMAVFRNEGREQKDESNDNAPWQLVFLHFNAEVESEKLLVGPDYEGFVMQMSRGTMGGT